MIAAVIGTIRCSSDGAATLSPSTAESTEIAGVIMLSPRNSEAPKMPSAASSSFVRRPPATRWRRISVISAMMPPSPVVVGAHHEQHVGDRDDDHHRPEDQRDDPEDAVGRRRDRVRVARIEDRLHRVERAGADVAEHHAQGADDQRPLRGAALAVDRRVRTHCTLRPVAAPTVHTGRAPSRLLLTAGRRDACARSTSAAAPPGAPAFRARVGGSAVCSDEQDGRRGCRDGYCAAMRARRSALSVPGSSERMLAKAAALPADEIVLDLEDAVALRRQGRGARG